MNLVKQSILYVVLLSSCSMHPNKFNCGSAKGAFCVPLHAVDEMINSGEIEKLDLDLNKQKKFRACK